MWKKLNS